jgi:hypothetical protein
MILYSKIRREAILLVVVVLAVIWYTIHSGGIMHACGDNCRRAAVRNKGVLPTEADHVLGAPHYTTVMMCPTKMYRANVDALNRWSDTLSSPEFMRFGTSASKQVRPLPSDVRALHRNCLLTPGYTVSMVERSRKYTRNCTL